MSVPMVPNGTSDHRTLRNVRPPGGRGAAGGGIPGIWRYGTGPCGTGPYTGGRGGAEGADGTTGAWPCGM
ncbi:hypothetical protein [Microtetraspora niveoalba]|uniref:hypothetical protein n=1 Tax=Microtetraspora niveoalba TaxID=46175 RepID=UPI0012F89A8B|nr:hypothetical protein [Microtetraspora niveoalba]